MIRTSFGRFAKLKTEMSFPAKQIAASSEARFDLLPKSESAAVIHHPRQHHIMRRMRTVRQLGSELARVSAHESRQLLGDAKGYEITRTYSARA